MRGKKRSLYEVLGVDRTASSEEIQRAFRRRARETHPDVAGAESKEAFQRVSAAYLLLKDADRRARYDETGEETEAPVSRPLELLLIEFRSCLTGYLQGQLTDIGAALGERLREKISKLQRAVEENKARLQRIEKLQPLVKFSGEGLDIIGEELRAGIESLKVAIRGAVAEREQLAAALELAEAYEFPADPSFASVHYGAPPFTIRFGNGGWQ